MILDDIDTTYLSDAQRAMVTFLKGRSVMADYMELLRLALHGVDLLLDSRSLLPEGEAFDRELHDTVVRCQELVAQARGSLDEIAILTSVDG
ncbi:hypothetical protein [Vulcanococcus limneticus]|nr:hypothetical protein [Vulcanococcus limneticus]